MPDDDGTEPHDEEAESPAQTEAEKKRAARRHLQISLLLVLFGIAGFWGYREWRLRQRHHVVLRASSTEVCRVRLQYEPGAKLDPLAQQVGVMTPWQLDTEARQEQEISLRVFGDASCDLVTCEITIDDVVMNRKTVSMKENPGVDSASCRIIAVDVHH